MKFLLDQDVYATTERFLIALGHDVVTAARLGLSQASDEAMLGVARDRQRIFVTRDRDFGALVFVKKLGAGVMYLRILPSTTSAVHEELQNVLTVHAEEVLTRAFVVVQPQGHRIRVLPQG